MGRGQQRAAKVRRRKAVVENRHEAEAVADGVGMEPTGGGFRNPKPDLLARLGAIMEPTKAEHPAA